MLSLREDAVQTCTEASGEELVMDNDYLDLGRVSQETKGSPIPQSFLDGMAGYWP
jgi:hypothetical protein